MALSDPNPPRDVVPGEDPLRRPPGARPTDAPDGSALDAHLLDLRARLKQARAERGGCPSWEELRADLVPGGRGRPGREERQKHAAICPYCSTHIREWRKSEDFASDRLDAIERGLVRGIAGGAQGLFRTLGRALPGRKEPATEAAPPEELRAEPTAPPVEPVREARLEEPAVREAPAARPAPRPAPVRDAAPVRAAAPARDAAPSPQRVLVVEMTGGRVPPESVFLCAQVLDAEVAQVDSVDELVGDPDLSLVCGVVLGGLRPPSTWPDLVRKARTIVPGRPVVLLATFGAEPAAGARRALGDALLSEADPAERLLLALDPGLR